MRTMVLLGILASGLAWAGERQSGGVTPSSLWQRECGACHITYPPYMLPPESWRKLMSGLDKHFDTDASLTAAETRAITDYLTRYAANPKYFDASPLRITETSRFRREHDQIEPAIIKRPAIKSLANCQACHPDAAHENFEEYGLKIPD